MLFPQTEQYALVSNPTPLPAPRNLLDGITADAALDEMLAYLSDSFTQDLPAPNQFDFDLISPLPLTPDSLTRADGSVAPEGEERRSFSISQSDDPFKPYRSIDPRRFEALANKLSPGIEELAKYGSSALSSNPLGLTSREIIKQLLRSK